MHNLYPIKTFIKDQSDKILFATPTPENAQSFITKNKHEVVSDTTNNKDQQVIVIKGKL